MSKTPVQRPRKSLRLLPALLLAQAAQPAPPAFAGSIPDGERAAKIIFKAASSGSFASAPSTGTVNKPGSGHQATRVFAADGSLLASGGPTASGWPEWLTSVEIGISGSSNSASKDPDCARFSAANEASDAKCLADDNTGAGAVSCGAQQGFYRIAEFECTRDASSATDGNGGPFDGVYVRATFSRDTTVLGSGENIMAVLEYSANALNSGAADPGKCMTNGAFNPAQAGCSDQVWQAFLKHSTYEVVQPYLMLVPPSVNVVDRALKKTGGGVATRQFILPLSADSGINTFQISRIRGIDQDNGDYATYCTAEQDGSVDPQNTAHCVGMVLYSLTFFRI